jgi:hypothetical protein
MSRALAVLLLTVSAAAAETVMMPEAFETETTGRTLYFSYLGQSFGAEQYFSDRRVLWRYADGSCQRGRWWPEGPRICFTYDGGPDAQCWAFHPRPSGFAAALLDGGGETGFVLELAGIDTRALDCPGPYVGS